ncbi:predicted protein [Enterococcus gallinarum EG2]|nr:predicted protein [Enterococcus gallinarum EG2]
MSLIRYDCQNQNAKNKIETQSWCCDIFQNVGHQNTFHKIRPFFLDHEPKWQCVPQTLYPSFRFFMKRIHFTCPLIMHIQILLLFIVSKFLLSSNFIPITEQSSFFLFPHILSHYLNGFSETSRNSCSS